jgi:hypothetical protein
MPKSDLLSSRDVIGRMMLAMESASSNNWAQRVSLFNGAANQDVVRYGLTRATPAMREWIGGRALKSLGVDSLEVETKKFEATLDEERVFFRRDLTGQLQRRVDGLADRASSHWKALATALLRAGATATTAYDGAAFFSAAHELGNSGVQRNIYAAAQLPELDVTLAAPTPLEMHNAIQAVIATFFGLLDDEGQPIHDDATDFVVIVPTRLYPSALAAATRSTVVGTGGAVAESTLPPEWNISVVPNARLRGEAADANKFYVFRAGTDAAGLILQEEEGMRFTAKAEGSEYEHDTDRWQFGVSAMRGAGYGLWQYAAQATLS